MTIKRRNNDDRITRKMVAAWRVLRDDPENEEARSAVLAELAARPWEYPASSIFAPDDAKPDFIPPRDKALAAGDAWWWITRELRARLDERVDASEHR